MDSNIDNFFYIFQATNQSNNNSTPSGGQTTGHPGQPGGQVTPTQTQQSSGQNQTSPMMGVNWGNTTSNNSNATAANVTSPWAQEQQVRFNPTYTGRFVDFVQFLDY